VVNLSVARLDALTLERDGSGGWFHGMSGVHDRRVAREVQAVPEPDLHDRPGETCADT
jgi:hypothetical protein